MEQNGRNGHFYLEVQEKPFRPGLLLATGNAALGCLLGILEKQVAASVRVLTRVLGARRTGA